jgi:Zn-dependent peptidase ImmA (M78 family)
VTVAIRRRKIETVVQELLAEHGIQHAPVPVERIAKASGARIYLQSLDDDVSGFLYRDKQQAVIGVNTHHAKVRQNFTTAHELGHFLLHDQEQLHVDHGFRVVRLRDGTSSQGVDEAEREANLFAATLLMPEEFLEADIAGQDYFDLLDDDGFLVDLARKYGVSTQALVNRLKNLGYIEE